MKLHWILLCVVVGATPCWDYLKQHSRPQMGTYVPQCTDAGFYDSKQCHASTGYCWCVLSDGTPIGQQAAPGVRIDC